MLEELTHFVIRAASSTARPIYFIGRMSQDLVGFSSIGP